MSDHPGPGHRTTARGRRGPGRSDAVTERLDAFGFLSRLDDPLAAVVREAGPVDAYAMGLPIEPHSAVELLAFGICSQQISQIAATAIFHRLRAALGGTIDPGTIDAADDLTLRAAGLSGNKIRGLRGLAEHVRTGRLQIARIGQMSDDELFGQLVAVPDIGPWSAQVFMMAYAHRPDVFPAADLGLRAAIAVLDGLPRPVTARAGERRSAVWRPYRSYASRYLWGLLPR
nr:hypothetical protein [uncultured Actinoplanes sp.]